MSSIKLQGDSSGSGVFTIATPNTDTNRSITIPDKAGAIAVGAGTVVQVVNSTLTSGFTTTSTSYTDTGLSATITPSSTSHKILILYNGIVGSSGNPVHYSRLTGDGGTSTLIETTAGGLSDTNNATQGFGGQNFTGSDRTLQVLNLNYLDSPSTTSAKTYKLQIKRGTSGTATFNRWEIDSNISGVATMTLMEIVA